MFKSGDPAWNDRNLREIAAEVRTRLLFAHIRASSGSPVQRSNCHPIRHGRWLWMHNGVLTWLRGDQERSGEGGGSVDVSGHRRLDGFRSVVLVKTTTATRPRLNGRPPIGSWCSKDMCRSRTGWLTTCMTSSADFEATGPARPSRTGAITVASATAIGVGGMMGAGLYTLVVAEVTDPALAVALKEINDRLRAALTALARRLYGRATRDTVERTTCAVVDLPQGAIRRHLVDGVAVPACVRSQLSAAIRAALADRPIPVTAIRKERTDVG